MDELRFIAKTLKETAQAVIKLRSRAADYNDIKGYLAEADLLAHQTIVENIRAAWSEDFVLSEEDNEEKWVKRKSQNDVRVWILDPICGTTNYVREFPFYAHSLSVMNQGGVLAAGIYHPCMDELFLADQNQTSLNGKRVKVSETRLLSQAIVSFNCNQSAPQEGLNSLMSLQKKLAPPLTRRLRILESANLELAYVACGRLDGYVNPEDKIWDIAAGSLMIFSAGGTSSYYQGTVLELNHCRGIIASNNHIFLSLKKAAQMTE